MILKHRDKDLLRFDWIGDTRVRIVSVNDAERRFLPLEFGEERLTCEEDALRYPLEDWLASRSAPVGRHFMRNLMESIGLNINSPSYPRKALEFSKGLSLFHAAQVAEALGFRHVKYELAKYKGRLCSKCRLSGFLQKRISDIRHFGRKVDEKDEQALNVESVIPNGNVGVKSSSGSDLNASEQKAVLLILRNSFIDVVT